VDKESVGNEEKDGGSNLENSKEATSRTRAKAEELAISNIHRQLDIIPHSLKNKEPGHCNL
jgi:hypothetical protein